MKLEGDNEFHRLAVETILSMCMNDINGKRIVQVEGFLSLTVESGEVFCIVIKEALDEVEHEANYSEEFHATKCDKQDTVSETLNTEEICTLTEPEAIPFEQMSACDTLTSSDKSQMATDKGPEMDGVTEDGDYVCSCCQESFRTVQDVQRHVKSEHMPDAVFCPCCFQPVSERAMVSHLVVCTVQGLDPERVKEAPSEDDLGGAKASGDPRVNGSMNGSKVFELCSPEIWEELSGVDKEQALNDFGNVSVKTEFQQNETTSDIVDYQQKHDRDVLQEEASEAFYQCPDCQRNFPTTTAFNLHVTSEHGYSVGESLAENRNFRCHMCKKVFTTSQRLFRHCQRSHKVEKCSLTGQAVYRCFCCSKVYPSYSELRRHRSLLHRSKPFTCRDCNLSFNSQGDQIYHRMRHHRKRSCIHCQLVFHGLISFTEHVRTCHPGIPVYKVNKQLICEFCSGIFADEKHLNDHIQSKHLGLVHTCDVCGKVLGTAETLRIHHRLHEAETYRTCDVCGKQFGRLAGLMEHMRSKHPENVPEKYRRSFNCLDCGLVFSRRHTLHRHIENKHEGKTFSCDICGKVFRSKRYIVRHKKTHHAGDSSSLSADSGKSVALVATKPSTVSKTGVLNSASTFVSYGIENAKRSGM